jgi:hypothetical protein
MVFLSNVKSIISHNKDTTKTFKQGINKLSDFSKDEIYAFYNLGDA